MALIGMGGSALHWIWWLPSKLPILNVMMVIMLEMNLNICARFNILHQLIHTYEYIKLATHVSGLTDEHYLGYLMHGLQPMIKARLRTLAPSSVSEAMDMACCVEEKLHLSSAPHMDHRFPCKPFGATIISSHHVSSSVSCAFRRWSSFFDWWGVPLYCWFLSLSVRRCWCNTGHFLATNLGWWTN